jgi:hypothetical protein
VAARDIVPVSGARFEDTLESASPDLLREMIKGFAQRMMDAEVEARCNAGYGEVTPERVNSRNGYRRREQAPGPGPSSWRSPSCGRAPTSRRSWSTGGGPSGRWPAWSPPATCWGSRPGGGEARRVAGGDRAEQVAGVRDGRGAG